ncbi:hypothetical protein [Nonomuraea dietziae]|uniref:hypothetical protein n=1 Tax=Nonomuraea dietziae TaxID=65515 RepID=UPI00344104AF
MDFKMPPAVLAALHEAVEYGVFGYPGVAMGLLMRTRTRGRKITSSVDRRRRRSSMG